jgi:hypothetical protein
MFFLIGPVTFFMSLDRTAIVVAAPTIQHEFAFTLVQMSWIITSFSWTCPTPHRSCQQREDADASSTR